MFAGEVSPYEDLDKRIMVLDIVKLTKWCESNLPIHPVNVDHGLAENFIASSLVDLAYAMRKIGSSSDIDPIILVEHRGQHMVVDGKHRFVLAYYAEKMLGVETQLPAYVVPHKVVRRFDTMRKMKQADVRRSLVEQGLFVEDITARTAI